MGLIDDLLALVDASSVQISERTRVVDIQFECKGKCLQSCQVLENSLNEFPKRDEITVIITNEIDIPYTLRDRNLTQDNGFKEYKSDIDEDENIKIHIEIKKSIEEGSVSIYNFKSFVDEIMSKNIIEVMDSFNKLLLGQKYLVFEIDDFQQVFSTKTLVFKKRTETVTTIESDRDEKLNNCKLASYFYNKTEYNLLPDDFYIVSTFENNPLKDIFNKIEVILSMAYISNSAHIEAGILYLQMVGQRNMDFKYNLLQESNIKINHEFYKIYNWIYTGGNPVDKAIIARNLMSLHCKYCDFIDIDEKTFASIQSNFNLYQRDNVTQYLELKSKLSEYVIGLSNNIGEIAVTLISRLKNSFVAFLTFLLSVLLTQLLSGNIENIFTMQVLQIIMLVLIGSLIYMGVSIYEVNIMQAELEEGYDQLKDNYIGILDDRDIQEAFKSDEVINKKKKKLKEYKWVIAGIWGMCIILGMICTGISMSRCNSSNQNKVINSRSNVTTSSAYQPNDI